MLIVIVIIGILAAALIPRLQGVRQRARDVAFKAHAREIIGAMELYVMDHGTYKVNGGAGRRGDGSGWVNYEDNSSTTKSIGRRLFELGYLSTHETYDSTQKTPPFYGEMLLYYCDNVGDQQQGGYGIFLKLYSQASSIDFSRDDICPQWAPALRQLEDRGMNHYVAGGDK